MQKTPSMIATEKANEINGCMQGQSTMPKTVDYGIDFGYEGVDEEEADDEGKARRDLQSRQH